MKFRLPCILRFAAVCLLLGGFNAYAEEITIDEASCEILQGKWNHNRCIFSEPNKDAIALCEKLGYSWEQVGGVPIWDHNYYCHPDSPSRCAAKGGKYMYRHSPFCLIPTSDGGKSCKNSSQCENRCIYVPPRNQTNEEQRLFPWVKPSNTASPKELREGQCAKDNLPDIGRGVSYLEDGEIRATPVP